MAANESPLRTASFAAPILAPDKTNGVGRVPDEWLVSPPVKEKGIEDYFDAMAAPRFKLYNQVRLRLPDGQRLRIDRIGFDQSEPGIKGAIGFEFKSGDVMTDSFTDFSKAIAQGIDYAHCRIESDIVGDVDWFGQQIKYVFIFPCLYSIYELNNNKNKLLARDWWAQGELKIAGKFGVGAISYVQSRRDWAFLLGGHPAYWMNTGPTDLAFKHAQGEKAGSGR